MPYYLRLDPPVPSETGFAFHGAGTPGNDRGGFREHILTSS